MDGNIAPSQLARSSAPYSASATEQSTTGIIEQDKGDWRRRLGGDIEHRGLLKRNTIPWGNVYGGRSIG